MGQGQGKREFPTLLFTILLFNNIISKHDVQEEKKGRGNNLIGLPHIETATDNDHGQSSSSSGTGGRTAKFIPSHRICPGLNSCLFVLMKEEGEDGH